MSPGKPLEPFMPSYHSAAYVDCLLFFVVGMRYVLVKDGYVRSYESCPNETVTDTLYDGVL